MTKQIERFKKDLQNLADDGRQLDMAMRYAVGGDEFKASIKKIFENDNQKTNNYLKNLPDFDSEYQSWYSESIALLRQILPDRVADFTRLYEKPKARKELTYDNYTIEDYLQGLQASRNGSVTVGRKADIRGWSSNAQ